MQAYGWPGNVRELESICRRLSAIFPGKCVDLYNVPPQFLPSEIVALMGSEIGNSDTTISGAETLAASLSDSLQQKVREQWS